jgi:hypothetical protein
LSYADVQYSGHGKRKLRCRLAIETPSAGTARGFSAAGNKAFISSRGLFFGKEEDFPIFRVLFPEIMKSSSVTSRKMWRFKVHDRAASLSAQISGHNKGELKILIFMGAWAYTLHVS